MADLAGCGSLLPAGRAITAKIQTCRDNFTHLCTNNLGKNDRNVLGPFGWGHCPSGALNEGYSTPQIPWYFTAEESRGHTPSRHARNRTSENKAKSLQKRKSNLGTLSQRRFRNFKNVTKKVTKTCQKNSNSINSAILAADRGVFHFQWGESGSVGREKSLSAPAAAVARTTATGT